MMTLHLIKFICFINYYNNYMPLSCRRSFTGKKVKTHKPRYCEKQMYKANKRMP